MGLVRMRQTVALKFHSKGLSPSEVQKFGAVVREANERELAAKFVIFRAGDFRDCLLSGIRKGHTVFGN